MGGHAPRLEARAIVDADELRRRNRAPLERVKAERRLLLIDALAPALTPFEADRLVDALEAVNRGVGVRIERAGRDVVIRLIAE